MIDSNRSEPQSKKKEKILLIDALNVIFQSYYGSLHITQTQSSGGEMLLFVFMRKIQSILRMAELRNINYACLVFDSRKRNARKKIYPGYKSNRVQAPTAIIEQIEDVKNIAQHYGINWLEINYAEADDSIGFLAKKFVEASITGSVYIVSTDNDFLQLMSDRVNIVKKIKKRMSVFTIKDYDREWLFKPPQIVDYKSICGDSSDHIPGVKGVGPITAANLISRFETIEGIYQNLELLSTRHQKLFLAHQEHVEKYKKIITINVNLNEKIDFASYCFPSPQRDIAKYNKICDRYKMYTIKIHK